MAEHRSNQIGDGGSIPTPALYFQTGRTEDAASLVMRFHYSKRVPNSITFTGTFHLAGGLFGDCGEAVAACMFGIPPARWGEPVLELQRLVRDESYKLPLSRLVSLTVRMMVKSGKCRLPIGRKGITAASTKRADGTTTGNGNGGWTA